MHWRTAMNKSVQNPEEAQPEINIKSLFNEQLKRVERTIKVLNAHHIICQNEVNEKNINWVIKGADELIIEAYKLKSILREISQ